MTDRERAMLAAVMYSFCGNQPHDAGRKIEVERFGASDRYYLETSGHPLDRYNHPFFRLKDQVHKFELKTKDEIRSGSFECYHTERNNRIRVTRFNSQEFEGEDSYYKFDGQVNLQHHDRIIIWDKEYPNQKFEYQIRYC